MGSGLEWPWIYFQSLASFTEGLIYIGLQSDSLSESCLAFSPGSCLCGQRLPRPLPLPGRSLPPPLAAIHPAICPSLWAWPMSGTELASPPPPPVGAQHLDSAAKRTGGHRKRPP